MIVLADPGFWKGGAVGTLKRFQGFCRRDRWRTCQKYFGGKRGGGVGLVGGFAYVSVT